MKPDDEILRPSDYEFYRIIQKWERPQKARSPEELTRDSYKSHDNIKELVRERDRLQKAVLELNEELESELQKSQKWRRLLITALVLTWTSWIAAVWWLLKFVAPLIIRGMSR